MESLLMSRASSYRVIGHTLLSCISLKDDTFLCAATGVAAYWLFALLIENKDNCIDNVSIRKNKVSDEHQIGTKTE